MTKHHINKTTQYLHSLLVEQKPWQRKLEQYAKAYRIPIIDRITMNVLTQYVILHQPSRILEIGTAIGYSTLCMHEAYPKAEIVTIEKDDMMYNQAQKNIECYKQHDRIHLLKGDAVTLLETIDQHFPSFDFVFIDAAKSQYNTYVNRIEPLLTKGSILVADNVLFRGYVSGEYDVPRRYKTLVKKISSFNERMMNDNKYDSSLLPIGDGLLICVKR